MKRIGLIAAVLMAVAGSLFAQVATAATLPLLSATITGTGGTTSFSLKPNQQADIFLLGGTATIQVEKSPDNGANWYKIMPSGTQIYVYTLSGDNESDTLQGSATGVSYRLNCTSFTSTVTVTVMQQVGQ